MRAPDPIDEVIRLAKERAARDDARRREQQDENTRIQDAHDTMPPSMSVDDMLEDCVWIAQGSQVGRLSAPRFVLSYGEFADLMAASAEVETTDEGRKRRVANATKWKHSPERKTVFARTFHAGAPVICTDPDGLSALNSWRPIERHPANADVQPFIDQVRYLVADDAEQHAFLDWLAHIEQKPGELPHYGWLHIADRTGTGRNWLASVLARVWRGYVAPNVDLPALLDSQFNGQLGGRILAIVDEVQEAAGDNPYRHANRLKSLVNAEVRALNPKYGRQYAEHNACRWLVFSNHANALPLNDTDRRWRVVHHDAQPRDGDTYARLYALLGDPEFINAVGVWLRARDISGFKPGERPPMNAAKRAAVDASRTMTQRHADEILAHWPCDVILNSDAAELLSDGADKSVTPAMRRALEEVGCASYPRTIQVGRKSQRCWVLRNQDRWIDARPSDVAMEAARARGHAHEYFTAAEVTSPGWTVAASIAAGPPGW